MLLVFVKAIRRQMLGCTPGQAHEDLILQQGATASVLLEMWAIKGRRALAQSLGFRAPVSVSCFFCFVQFCLCLCVLASLVWLYVARVCIKSWC